MPASTSKKAPKKTTGKAPKTASGKVPKTAGGKYVSVAVNTPLRQTFQYSLPPEMPKNEQALTPGCRIRIPFGARSVTGIVTSIDQEPKISTSRIKPALELLNPDIKVAGTVFKLCLWATDYYAHPIGEVFASALPTLIRRGKEPKHEPAHPFELKVVRHEGITPTPAQQEAVDTINADQPCLLYGITGSGKTEVYLRLMENCLKAGRQSLVLVPEIGLTPQTVERFRARFDVEIAVLHSGMTDRERAIAWLAASRGEVGIVLGTRSAVFTPLLNPGIIIVDEEHDASFKQQEGFHYSARDLAVLRASWEKVPVLLGSATPSLESLHNVEIGKYRQFTLENRPDDIQAESYRLVNLERTPAPDGFSKPLLDKMNVTLGKGQQVLVFLNRRGYAPVLYCNSCKEIASCTRCDAKLTCHLGYSRLVCHHCGLEEKYLQQCRVCQSTDLSALGMGTQRVEEALAERFPDYPVIRIDRDSTRKKGTLESLLARVHSGEPAILVGTQLLAKGHHFPGVSLVAILDIDSGFYSADFKAMEKTGQLILQVGGRSGRAEHPGEVVIQTRFAEHKHITNLLKQGYAAFAEELLQERKAAGLPPWTYHALIRAKSQKQGVAAEFLRKVASLGGHEGVQVLGPVPALMEKKAGWYRQQLLLAATDRARLHEALKDKVNQAFALPDAKRVRWSVDVDPTELY